MHVEYEGKKTETKTKSQYLNKLKTVYEMMINEPIMECFVHELKKLMDGNL